MELLDRGSLDHRHPGAGLDEPQRITQNSNLDTLMRFDEKALADLECDGEKARFDRMASKGACVEDTTHEP